MHTWSVAERDIEGALEDLTAALGGAVDVDAATLREFRDPYWLRGSEQYDPSCIVTPTTVEQVQSVVRIANKHKVPLWTISQGRNNGYGGPAARVRGSIVVNLREMNRVLEINEELAYAVVEPGVRFLDLNEALAHQGRSLWGPTPDLGWGSVIGNALDLGRGYTEYGDHASAICGMEVVLPSGELLRTGMGAMANGKAWHVYPHAFGPKLEGLFFQSGLGIVTSLGVWLMPRPEMFSVCAVTFQGDEPLAAVIEGMRGLLLDGVVRNPPALGRGIAGMKEDIGGDSWVGRFALYGREYVVEAQWRAVRDVLGAIPGVEVERTSFGGEDPAMADDHDVRVMCGIPDLELLEIFQRAHGEDTGHLDFSPIGPLTADEVTSTVALMRSLYEQAGHPYICDLVICPRSVIHVSTALFDTSDEAQTRHIYGAYRTMVEALSAKGYPLYRTNTHYMDFVAEQFDFNDHIYRRVNETIKDALDPNGILQPGKQGIWGSGLREQRRIDGVVL